MTPIPIDQDARCSCGYSRMACLAVGHHYRRYWRQLDEQEGAA